MRQVNNTTYKITTSSMLTAYRRAGNPGSPKLMLLHGNASSSVFFLPLMARLEESFEIVAPDMRCFGDSEALPVDATRGMRDFSDDLDAFAKAIAWDRFALLGWSLGGGVAMQYAIDHGEKLTALILENPLSPYGFGGTYGEDGRVLEPAGLASGAGCVNAQLVESLLSGERGFIEKTIDSVYVSPGFKLDPQFKEICIDGVLSTKLGEGMYPGDKKAAQLWPFVSAGESGICNTMAPNYCNLSGFSEISSKPPVLWIRGAQDIMVSDTSIADLAYLGKSGIISGYPGEEACPPQPMVSQTRYVLKKYESNGGFYTETVIDGGHGCMLDNEDAFVFAIKDFMCSLEK